ncbi:MAG: hypothetical protein Q8R18_01875 [bacterium]|nr:hypothetical protein [bacterium]
MKRGFVLFSILIVFLTSLFFIAPVLGVNACCEKDNEGNWCQYTDESNCDESSLSTYTSCEQTSFCQVGCCYSSDEGNCHKNTPRATCEAEEDYSWSDSSECAIDQCNKGCCVIADQAFFVTEVKCKSVGSAYEEASVAFDDTIETESNCLNSVKNLDFGCCVSGTSALFETRETCNAASTEVGVNFTVDGFHEGLLCSNDLLSTECAKQQYTGCYQGKVYWYDSCANRENIYTSDERESYNNGYVLEDEDSCSASGAYDTSCGNCDYSQGMLCGADESNVMDDGDYTCIDLSCEKTYENDASPLSGQERRNGESWCVYDSRPGQALDAVGSRHYRHLCINGEEIVEPCTDYREQLCMNGVLTNEVLGNLEGLNLGDGEYVEAACRENRNDCSACNSPESLSERYDCCGNEDLRDCFWKESENVPLEFSLSPSADDTPYGVCLPQVPPGLKFWGESSSSSAEVEVASAEECSVASATCTVSYRLGGWNKILGGKTPPVDSWQITGESPDGCKSRDWLVNQNTFCKAQGDCGAYYNYAGEAGFEGFRSSMFDEEYFFDFKDLETKDIGSWDYLVNVDEIDESDAILWNNPNVWKNPVTYVAIASVIVGGVSNAVGGSDCAKAAAAKGASGKSKSPFDYATEEAATKAASDENIDTCGDSAETKGYSCSCAAGDAGVKEGYCYAAVDKYCCPAATASKTTDTAGAVTATNTNANSVTMITHFLYPDEETAQKAASERKRDTCGESDGTKGYSCSCASATDKDAKEGYCWETRDKYCCPSRSASPAPEVPQFAVEDTLVEKGQGLAMDKILDSGGCFVEGALPLPTTLFGGLEKGAVTKIANWVTVITAVYLVVEYANDNETTVSYTADCNLWQPPTGGGNCELCNDQYAPCSEYKCRSLGASCDLVNEGTSNETCVSLYVNDVNSPLITPQKEALRESLTITETEEEGDKGYEINELIPAFTPVTFAIETDEPALCHYSSEVGVEYDTMANTFGTGIYTYEHALTFSLGDEVTSEEVVALTQGIHTIYIRCTDSNGNANERDYFIRFTVDTTPDLTPPEVKYTSITNGAYMPYNASETALSIYTNEPAQCKWNSNDSSYEFMSTTMACADSGFQQSSAYYGTYECATILTGVANDKINSFYFKCMDQAGNDNEDSFKFITKQTESPLEITSILPSGTLFDLNVSLEIETEGGAELGKAVCGYNIEDVDYYSMAQFFNTNSSIHSQALTLSEGEYSYYIACQDIAGNRATDSTSFTVEIDTDGPEIEALYLDTVYKKLLLTLNEDATCEYASDSFIYGEGIAMNGEGETEHEANLEAAQYYVICEDAYDNQAEYYIDLSTWI